VLDELTAVQPRTWTWLLQSDWPAEEVSSRLHAVRSGPAQAWVTRLAPSGVQVSQTDTEIEANPTASTPSLRITKTLRTLRWTTPRLTTAHFLAAIEPTSALSPTAAVASAISEGCEYGVDFGDEVVLLSPSRGSIEVGGVSADAGAVIHSGDQLGVVRATRLVLNGRVLIDADTPYTGLIKVPR